MILKKSNTPKFKLDRSWTCAGPWAWPSACATGCSTSWRTTSTTCCSRSVDSRLFVLVYRAIAASGCMVVYLRMDVWIGHTPPTNQLNNQPQPAPGGRAALARAAGGADAAGGEGRRGAYRRRHPPAPGVPGHMCVDMLLPWCGVVWMGVCGCERGCVCLCRFHHDPVLAQ